MAKTLVIVESPTKAQTIGRFLGDEYDVQASYGHVRDLPESADEVPDEIKKKKWGRLGIDTDGDFKPYYVIPDDKRKHVQALKAALKGAGEVMLATDPDREGESISWHLLQVLKPKVPVKRIVFHEITEKAIDQAVKDAHDVDDNLVRAQESRRILDRLYGYTLSPVLWKKVQTGLSAGRVQSIAVRLIVERESERLAFRDGALFRSRRAILGRRPDVRRHAVANRRRAHRQRQGFRRQWRPHCQERPPARRRRRGGARRDPRSPPAVDGGCRGRETGHRASRRAVHHLHAHAGSEPQARILHAADDAGGAAAVSGRSHLLSPDRFDDVER